MLRVLAVRGSEAAGVARGHGELSGSSGIWRAVMPVTPARSARGPGRPPLPPRLRCRDRLEVAERLFHYRNMSSDPADLTAAAAIRIAAMKLFAERGYAEVTVRQIASAAGGSPALVIHHYGAKENLRAVLRERVAAFVESMLADLARVTAGGGSTSVAELFADRLEREPGLAGYVRRLLADGGSAGVDLFGRLY